ncbi:MAG: sigma-54-dependent Fis family transcriptional regulator [Gammaproteobacteria bacterium 39-13]|nr:sigma-54-dependent Fis family transcriptional regulator [Gammaproteobacteria bacterium]OJV90327.1 MAG: sigma-54-dependent Fis family transcriptional regulator [Gammaproteobacteria bacterium 39-13]
MTQSCALIIDDEPDICRLLEITLNRMSIKTLSVHNLQEAKKALRTRTFDLCLTDMRLPDGDGLDLVSFVQENHPNLPIAVITAHGNMETAIRALKSGAFDFISKPIDLSVFRDIISTALKINAPEVKSTSDFLIGQSEVMHQLREKIIKLARSQAPVYISGSSGTGKELVAKIIHQSGPRHDAPFIPVNCGAIPQELMESEFFGHLKGSFTGATHDKIGFFQAANKGTLFLDEVADLPLSMQVKLLRAIQEKAIRPIGSAKEINTDVRILCATHNDLHELVRQNAFRQDLFYRLNVIELNVPSLKERLDDIPLLTQHILEKIARNNNKPIPIIEKEVMNSLSLYDFPGNIRELENILERAFTLSNGKEITHFDLQLPVEAESTHHFSQDPELPLDDYLLNIERQTILNALEKTNMNKTKAAKLLGISFRTLRYRLKKLGLSNE